MKPTQAQIEAAARAIRAVLHKDHRGAKGADALAKAALTAAHEAWLSETFSERWQAAKDRAAAAEVGEKKQSSIGPHYLPTPELDDAARTAAAEVGEPPDDTIERCAQVAENFRETDPYQILVDIAAAIRSLKDKP